MPGPFPPLLQSSTDFNELPMMIPGPFETAIGCGALLVPLLVAGVIGDFIGSSKGRAQGRQELLEELEIKRDLDLPPR